MGRWLRGLELHMVKSHGKEDAHKKMGVQTQAGNEISTRVVLWKKSAEKFLSICAAAVVVMVLAPRNIYIYARSEVTLPPIYKLSSQDVLFLLW